MNISDYIKPAMAYMVTEKEGEIKRALDDFWGTWSLRDIGSRCRLERVEGSPVETLIVDGVPILEIHPMEFSEPVLEGDRYVQRVTQNFRRLGVHRTTEP